MSVFKRYNGTNWETIGGGTSLDVYSTTEHVVGTWINGKPVYEKQIEGTTTAGGDKSVLIDSNLKRGWIVEGYVVATSGGSMIPLNYYSSSTIYIKSTVLADGNFKITTGSNSGFINGNFTATIRYTKTTD